MAHEEFTNVLKSTDEIELTVTGRISGRKTSRPVWFVRDGATLYLLPVTGSDSAWYKNALKNPTITLAAKGAKLTAKWSAPHRVDTGQAARLTIRRACSCSNLAGLRYPSAEWSRLLL